MNHDLHISTTQTAPSRAAWYQRPSGIAGAMAALILGFYLLREHWYHIAGYWSYLLLLACPLIHLFHGGHHRHGRKERAPAVTDNAGE